MIYIILGNINAPASEHGANGCLRCTVIGKISFPTWLTASCAGNMRSGIYQRCFRINQTRTLIHLTSWQFGRMVSSSSTELVLQTYRGIHIDRIPSFSVEQLPGELANESLIRCGLLGVSPVHPTVAISLDTLEFYHRLRRRHPQLGIQAICRALCDIHNITYMHNYREQFSTAFDVYLSILRSIHEKSLQYLGRNLRNWRIQNACPCCHLKVSYNNTMTL